MKNQELPTPGRVLARRTLGAAAIAVVALSAAVYVAIQVQSPATTPAGGTPTSSASPPAAGSGTSGDAPAPATAGPLPPDQADAAVKKFLDASVAVDPAAPGTTDALTNAAAGAILAEAQNDRQELEANGWTREGAATVEALTIIQSDSQAQPAIVVAEACVDSSMVRTLDADGEPVGTSGDSAQRALNLYTLQYLAGAWKVVARSFPDEFAC